MEPINENMLIERAIILDERSQYQMHKSAARIHWEKYFFKNIKYIFAYRKKSFLKRTGTAIAILFAIIYPLYYYVVNPNVVEKWQIMPKETVYVSDEKKTMDLFLHDLGEVESGGNYKITNQYGYMGKYQIGMQALKQIGLESVTKEQFLDNPELQEAAMKMLLKENKKMLATYIGKYQSRVIGGIYITESSILAASHMAPKGTIDFLTSDGENVFRDGNGTPITKYLEKFSGYKIKLK